MKEVMFIYFKIFIVALNYLHFYLITLLKKNEKLQ
jgi:hypothetical protein